MNRPFIVESFRISFQTKQGFWDDGARKSNIEDAANAFKRAVVIVSQFGFRMCLTREGQPLIPANDALASLPIDIFIKRLDEIFRRRVNANLKSKAHHRVRAKGFWSDCIIFSNGDVEIRLDLEYPYLEFKIVSTGGFRLPHLPSHARLGEKFLHICEHPDCDIEDIIKDIER